MAWNLLTIEELKAINEKVIAEDTPVSVVIKESALSAATEGEAFEYEEKLSGAVYLVAVAIAQWHPFEDGNKRTATKAVKKFLKRNGRIPTEEEMEDVQELIGRLADDEPIEKEEFVEELERILSLETEG